MAFNIWQRGKAYIEDLTVGTQTVQSQTFTGNTTVGDAVTDVLIQKGRYSTGSTTGSALSLGAAYTYGEGTEERWTVTSFTGINGDFRGKYVRAQSDIDSENTVMGMEVYGVANAADVGALKGAYIGAYIKGDTAETIAGGVWGVHGEVSMDASRVNSITLTTGAAAIHAKILSGKVADYTAIHGIWAQFGDMDGGSRTYGDGLKLVDSADESGTSVLTNGVNVNIGTTTGVLVNASATDAFKTATGTFTNGLNVGGTVTTGVTIGAATTGVAITGATTSGVAITGNATDAFKTLTGTFTNGVNIAGTVTTGVTVGAATTGFQTTGSQTNSIKIHTTTGAVMVGTASSTNAYFLDAPTGSMAVDTTIAGQVVGTINCVVKCKFASTDFYLYGYAGKPTT